MPKVHFMCVDPRDDACYKFRNDGDDLFVLYTDGRHGNVEGVNPGFWEKFYGASVIDIDYRVKDGKNVIVKVNFVR